VAHTYIHTYIHTYLITYLHTYIHNLHKTLLKMMTKRITVYNKIHVTVVSLVFIHSKLYLLFPLVQPGHSYLVMKNFMNFFALKYFMKYFRKFTMFFLLYTHPFNIYYTSNITFHSFMHTAAVQLPKSICWPTCLVCLLKYG